MRVFATALIACICFASALADDEIVDVNSAIDFTEFDNALFCVNSSIAGLRLSSSVISSSDIFGRNGNKMIEQFVAKAWKMVQPMLEKSNGVIKNKTGLDLMGLFNDEQLLGFPDRMIKLVQSKVTQKQVDEASKQLGKMCVHIWANKDKLDEIHAKLEAVVKPTVQEITGIVFGVLKDDPLTGFLTLGDNKDLGEKFTIISTESASALQAAQDIMQPAFQEIFDFSVRAQNAFGK